MTRYLLVFLALAAFDAQAAIHCAKTGNELGNAMLTASGNSVDDEIRVVVGTHTSNLRAPDSAQWRVDSVESHDGDHNLTISGGWDAADNCATQISFNPSSTVLDALYFGPVFAYTTGQEPMVGTFTIRNLSFNRGMATSDGSTSGLLVTVELSGAGSAVVENVHVLNGQSEVSSARALDLSGSGSGAIRLRNSIVSLNTYTLSTSAMVRIQPQNGVVAYVSNNSIFSNATTNQVAGLNVTGVATLSNNAIADNTSTANPHYQFYSEAPTGLTLVKNHFGTKGFANGAPFSESDTTTGDAAWAGLGVERIPLDVSPLRDSGNNSPTGGALAIDFRGNPRVVNTVIDRGASEAPLAVVPGIGPIVTPNTPVSASTTWLFGVAGEAALGEITFSSSGGGVNGLTEIVCEATGGTVLILANDSQYVATGFLPEPMLIGFDNLTSTLQTGVIFCSIQRGGIPGFTFASYNFKGGLQTMFEDGFESP
jgi:hypothetical protein